MLLYTNEEHPLKHWFMSVSLFQGSRLEPEWTTVDRKVKISC